MVTHGRNMGQFYRNPLEQLWLASSAPTTGNIATLISVWPDIQYQNASSPPVIAHGASLSSFVSTRKKKKFSAVVALRIVSGGSCSVRRTSARNAKARCWSHAAGPFLRRRDHVEQHEGF